MSIAGSSSIRRLKDVAVVMDLHELAPVGGRPASDAAVGVTVPGAPLEYEWGPGTVSQEMLERLKVARHVAVEERDPHTRVNRKPAMLPGEHVGGRVRIEKTLPPEPADHAAPSRGRGDGGVACSSQRRRSSQSNFSISSRKILVTAATALGRSPRTPRSRLGREMTHCRTGTGGMT